MYLSSGGRRNTKKKEEEIDESDCFFLFSTSFCSFLILFLLTNVCLFNENVTLRQTRINNKQISSSILEEQKVKPKNSNFIGYYMQM